MSLKPVADGGAGCELDYTVQAQVGGKIAQLGQRLIDGAREVHGGRFLQALRRRDAAPRHGVPPADAPEAAEAPAGSRPAPLAGFMQKLGIGTVSTDTADEQPERVTTWKTST